MRRQEDDDDGAASSANDGDGLAIDEEASYEGSHSDNKGQEISREALLAYCASVGGTHSAANVRALVVRSQPVLQALVGDARYYARIRRSVRDTDAIDEAVKK